MTTDKNRINWEINNIRQAIDADWAQLASKTLTPDERKKIREHMRVNIMALDDLKTKNQLSRREVKEPTQLSIFDDPKSDL